VAPSIKLTLSLFKSVTCQDLSLSCVIILVICLEGFTCQNQRGSKIEDDSNFDT